jgi:hypothetical protein
MTQFNLEKGVMEIITSAIHDFIRYYYKSEHNSDVDDITLETLTVDTMDIYYRTSVKYGKFNIIDATIIVCLVHDNKSSKDKEATDTFHRLRKVFNEEFKNATAVLMETNSGYEIETNDE